MTSFREWRKGGGNKFAKENDVLCREKVSYLEKRTLVECLFNYII